MTTTPKGFPAGRQPDDIKRQATPIPSPDSKVPPPPVPPNLDPDKR